MSPKLRFLADESCDFAVVRAIRADGYDVLAVSEYTQRSDDQELNEQAYLENRIVLTEDKDFGWLVFVSQVATAGVILIRFPGNRREALVRTVRILIQEKADEIQGAFVVLQPGHVRISQKPVNRL